MFEDKIQELNKNIEAQPTPFEKRTYTVSEIQDILGVGRTAAYNIVKAGYFKVVRIGGSIRVPKRSFDAWLDSLDKQSEESQVCD
ncbi:MAG: helix-turn-helix domain-containing protein [Ruminococcus sp.]|nr:helix-turn-helix domain-containing protein [Ruminococcus sp.]